MKRKLTFALTVCLLMAGTSFAQVYVSPPSLGGNVTGPASSTDGDCALFDGTTGKKIKDGGPCSGGSGGAGTFTTINNTCYANEAAGADLGAKINTCVNSLATTGGWVIVDAFGGTLTTAPLIKQGVRTFWYPGVFTVCGMTVNEGASVEGSGAMNFVLGGEPGTAFVAPNGCNADVIFAHDHNATYSNWANGTLTNFSVHGNSANQTTGSCIRIYSLDIDSRITQVTAQDCKQAAWRIDGSVGTNTLFSSVMGATSPYGYWFTASASPEPVVGSQGSIGFNGMYANSNGTAIRIEPGGRFGLSISRLIVESNTTNVIDIDTTNGFNPSIMVDGVETNGEPTFISYTGTAAHSPLISVHNLVNMAGTPTNLYLDHTTAGNTVTWANGVYNNRVPDWTYGYQGSTHGTWISFPAQSVTLSNGANNNVALGSTGSLPAIEITGPTGAFSISGFAGESALNGRELAVYNTTSQAMTLTNDATSTAANRIFTNTGANVVFPAGTSSATFKYSAGVSRWVLMSTSPAVVATAPATSHYGVAVVSPLAGGSAATATGIAKIQSTSALISAANGSLAFTSVNTAGNTIVAVVRTTGGSSSTPTDLLGNSYSIAVANVQLGSTTSYVSLYYAQNIKGGANTVSFTSSGSSIRVAILEYPGILAVSSLDQTHSASGAGNTVASGATTTTAQNIELAIGVAGTDDAVTAAAAGSSWTLEESVTASVLEVEDQVLTSTGTPNATWPAFTTTPSWGSIVATFKGNAINCPTCVTSSSPVVIRVCEIVIGGTGASNILQTGDDTIAGGSCYNGVGVTETITGVYCLADTGTTTTVTPILHGGGTILSGALTCGNNVWSSTGTLSGTPTITALGSVDGAITAVGTAHSVHIAIKYTVPAS